jgi:chromosome segregation ATPase
MELKNKSSQKLTAALLAVLFVIVIIGGFTINKHKKAIHQLTSDNTLLEISVQERDSMVNEFIATLDTIESSLTFINQKRSQLVLKNNEITGTQKDAIISDIQLMNTMLEESSKKIADLELKLKKSGIQLASFKKKIADLANNIEQQNNLIAELKLQYHNQNVQLAMVNLKKDSLESEVLAFRDTLQHKIEMLVQKDEIISQQSMELNKGYFTFGTIKELTDHGVISKHGGFLGIGRNTTLLNNFNEDYFTKINKSERNSIELNAKKANLISEHPSNSYKLIEEDGLITKLEIETPEDFWKISQYAVIEIK